MDVANVRGLFRDFAGEDRYREFVRTLNRVSLRKGRLFFWQEQLWREFVANAPGVPTSEQEVMDMFRVCDVHGDGLETSSGDDSSPEIRDTPEYDRVRDTLFPFAVGGDLVCAKCRSQRQRWISEHPDLCQILRQKTTYEAYCDRQLEEITDGSKKERIKKEAQEGVKKRAAEIAAEMQPGDELWEWDGGGWHRLTGRGGVAIVRGGMIVRRWCLVKS
jgi:hypothetical protein